MRFSSGARTDVGRVREGNEDSYLAEFPVFVVADGMGGHLAGDVASDTAVKIIAGRSGAGLEPGHLSDVVREANSAIWNKSQEDAALRGMGTTCTLMLLEGSTAHIAHVGDSRAYLRRSGELEQLTEDHSLVGRMVREGRLRAEDAEHHPQRSIITRALGVDDDVDVDVFTVDLQDGDRLLLCSDGLTSMVESDDINLVLAQRSDPQDAAERLVEMANDAGGEDNVTVVVVHAHADDGRAAAAAGAAPQQWSESTAPSPSAAGAWQQGPGDGRHHTPAEPAPAPAAPAPTRSPLRWALWLLVLVVVVLVALFMVQTALGSSFYVGVDETGAIAIFRGIPEDVLGLSLREVEERTGIMIADVPEFLRDNFRQGRKVESLREARAVVSDLEERVEEFKKDTTRRRPDPEPTARP